MSDVDENSVISSDSAVEKTDESENESTEDSKNDSENESEEVSEDDSDDESDDDLPVDILIKNITKDKLMLVLEFIHKHQFEYTEDCIEVSFADENNHYFQKYVRSYIQENTTLPKFMEPIVNDQIHHIQNMIEDLGEDNDLELLYKIENMTYH